MQSYTVELEGTIKEMEHQASVQAKAERREKDERQRTQEKLAEGFAIEEAAAHALRQETEVLTHEIAMLRAKLPTTEIGIQTEEPATAPRKKWLCF